MTASVASVARIERSKIRDHFLQQVASLGCCWRSIRATSLRRHAQLQAGALLQVADDAEQILRLRIATRAEHADQALGRRADRLGKPLEADRGLDVVAQ